MDSNKIKCLMQKHVDKTVSHLGFNVKVQNGCVRGDAFIDYDGDDVYLLFVIGYNVKIGCYMMSFLAVFGGFDNPNACLKYINDFISSTSCLRAYMSDDNLFVQHETLLRGEEDCIKTFDDFFILFSNLKDNISFKKILRQRK